MRPFVGFERFERLHNPVRYLFFVLTWSLSTLLLVGSTIIFFIIKDNPSNIVGAIRTKMSTLAKPTIILDRHDRELAALIHESRIYKNIDTIPDHVQKAFLAAEDADFYQHSGVSFSGSIRSLLVNFSKDRVVQGGSTITQQLVRQMLLTPEKTLRRKIKELDLAIRLEHQLKKKEILELWLNHVYLGHNAWGVEAAAQIYFGKSSADVSVAEACMLAGLLPAPSLYAPHRNIRLAKQRQIYVLDRLVARHWLSYRAANVARNAHIAIKKSSPPAETTNPWISEAVRKEVSRRTEIKQLPQIGLKIKTTIHRDWQKLAQTLIHKRLKRFQINGYEASLVALENSSGSTLVRVGGIDFTHNQFDRSIYLKRSIGETINPVIFAWTADGGITAAKNLTSLGQMAIASQFRDVDPLIEAVGFGQLRERLLQLSFLVRDIRDINEVKGSPMQVAHLWRSISGYPLRTGSTLVREIKDGNGASQFVSNNSGILEGISESTAFSIRHWLTTSKLATIKHGNLVFETSHSWNHWMVATNRTFTAVFWAGADGRPSSSLKTFTDLQQQVTSVMDDWLASVSQSLIAPNSEPPAGISWYLIKNADQNLVRVPFPSTISSRRL